jgi:predicted molibdopterin-dependent oxidoreductase YjgC
MKYDDAQAIMKEIAGVTPSYCGISYERLENDGIHWPCPSNDHPGTPCLHVDKFSCGLGIFHAIDYLPPAEATDGDYPLYLTTGRVLYQYHTGTMTMKSQELNGIEPDCFVEISAHDAGLYDIGDGDLLKISSRRGNIEANARISDKAVKGTIFIPFHYVGAAANMLTNGALDPVAKIPEYKVCAVKLKKAA